MRRRAGAIRYRPGVSRYIMDLAHSVCVVCFDGIVKAFSERFGWVRKDGDVEASEAMHELV